MILGQIHKISLMQVQSTIFLIAAFCFATLLAILLAST